MPRGIEHKPKSIVVHQFRVLYPRITPASDRHPDGQVLQVEERYSVHHKADRLGDILAFLCESSSRQARVEVGTIMVPRNTNLYDTESMTPSRLFTVKSPQRI